MRLFQFITLTLGAAVLAFAVIASATRMRTTVFEYERGLRFRRGRFDRVLDPGVYWHVPWLSRIDKLDVRPTRAAMTGQEVLSGDGVAVKASLVATYRIVDPQRAVLTTDDFRTAVYSELQLAFRAIVAETSIEELLQKRGTIPSRLKAIVAEKVAALGIELQDASLRDLTFPGELKKIFTQVVKARQEGLAVLEKARGETAALRSLANAARMVESNPHLLQLRLLQVLAQQPGNTLVLGMQQSGSPIPIRGASTTTDLAPPETGETE